MSNLISILNMINWLGVWGKAGRGGAILHLSEQPIEVKSKSEMNDFKGVGVILYSVNLEYKKHVFYIIIWKCQLISSFSMKSIYSFHDCYLV